MGVIFARQGTMGDDDGYSGKLTICGDGAIGKTCLLKRLTTDTDADWETFGTEYEATTFGSLKTVWEDGEACTYNLDVWDTAGQESMADLRKMSYPGTQVMIIGYNCTDIGSLNNVEYTWIPEIKGSVGDDEFAKMRLILVGTKVDMRDEMPGGGDASCVMTYQAEEVAVKIGASAFVETSAKTGQGCVEVQGWAMACFKEITDTPDKKDPFVPSKALSAEFLEPLQDDSAIQIDETRAAEVNATNISKDPAKVAEKKKKAEEFKKEETDKAAKAKAAMSAEEQKAAEDKAKKSKEDAKKSKEDAAKKEAAVKAKREAAKNKPKGGEAAADKKAAAEKKAAVEKKAASDKKAAADKAAADKAAADKNAAADTKAKEPTPPEGGSNPCAGCSIL